MKIWYRRAESVQIYTSLCMSVGDSSPPLKKERIKRTQKSTGIFIDLVSLRDLSQRSCRQDSCCYLAAKLGSLSQARIAENCFWAGDSRQSTHTIQDSSLSFSFIFIGGCLWVCLWVELFFSVLFLLRRNNGFRSFLTETCLFNPVFFSFMKCSYEMTSGRNVRWVEF